MGLADKLADAAEAGPGDVASLGRLLNRVPDHLRPPDPTAPRGRILDAAKSCFAEKGLEAASTREIADAAEVNLAMIHYYFGSKEQLYRRVLAGMILELFQQVADSLQPQLPPAQQIMQFPVLVMTAIRDTPATAAVIRREIAGGAPHLQEVVRSLGELGPQGFSQALAALYRDGVAAGELRDLPVDAVREFLITLAYSSVFMEPLFQLISRERNHDRDAAWHERRDVFAQLIRQSLLVEPPPQ